MKNKEASARIKINKLLEDAGWRFFDDEKGPANIQLETNVKITKKQIDECGENFEKVKNYYDNGIWNEARVYNAVGKWITAEEYKEITKEDYE